VWKVAGGRQNGDLEIAFELAKAAEFLDRRGRSLLSPDEECRLTQSAKCVPDIDVEIARQERGRRVASATLV